MKYKALFLDADDTIFDYHAGETEAFRLTAVEFGFGDRIAEAQQRYRVHNAEVWKALEQKRITQDELKIRRFALLLDDLHADTTQAPRMSQFYLDRLSEQTQLLPGAEEAVAALAKRYLLVLVTNGLTYVQRRRFAAAPVTKHFSSILISEEIGTAKPDPAIFTSALQEFKLDPHRILLIGDSTSSDMPAARNAGMDFCWINPLGAPVPDGFTPRYDVRSLADIPAMLLRD
ncbi:MAG: noncanonical pyrimidine nucleotidase, YjjG family [Ignavibacteria bacterium]|nr:MAG: noncanonical pyrimidine nucleotidase, YjjG family [Ignavibacteria bacterium]